MVFRDLLLYGLTAFCFGFGLWFLMVGSFNFDDNRGKAPVTVEYDTNKVINSFITSGLWTLAVAIQFLMHPSAFTHILAFVMEVLNIQPNNAASGIRAAGMILFLLNTAIAYGIRTFFKSQTNLEVDLPREVLEEYEHSKEPHNQD